MKEDMKYYLNYLLRYLPKIYGNKLKNLTKTFKAIHRPLLQGEKQSKCVVLIVYTFRIASSFFLINLGILLAKNNPKSIIWININTTDSQK